MNIYRGLLACCLAVGLAAFDGGCSSCESPYDYSGPTIGRDGKPIGGFGTRVGSRWAGTNPVAPPPAAPTMTAPGTSGAMPPMSTPPINVPGEGASSASLEPNSGSSDGQDNESSNGPSAGSGDEASESTADMRAAKPSRY